MEKLYTDRYAGTGLSESRKSGARTQAPSTHATQVLCENRSSSLSSNVSVAVHPKRCNSKRSSNQSSSIVSVACLSLLAAGASQPEDSSTTTFSR